MSCGGLLWDQVPVSHQSSLFHEGLAMLMALAEDLNRSGHSTLTVLDHRLKHRAPAFPGNFIEIHHRSSLPRTLVSAINFADAALVIAPESGSRLLLCHQWMKQFADSLLVPTGQIVTIGSSKSRTADCLTAAGVQMPFGIPLNLSSSCSPDWPDHVDTGPWILKPDDGAGCEAIVRMAQFPTAEDLKNRPDGQWRLEKFLPGVSCSVSAVVGPAATWLLPPTAQIFHQPRSLPYIPDQALPWPGVWCGFDFPLLPELAQRATDLARRAIHALPGFTGHVGMDMILSDAGPADDRIVDLNPRMTSSWVGLRQLFDENITERMVLVTLGQAVSPDPQPVVPSLRFRIDP